MTDSFSTPVLFLIFNRPATTQKVFEKIRKAQPKYLYISADGPRKDKIDDIENCKKTREIVQKVDWDCNVSTLFRDENLGCKKAVSSGIDWFFSHVEEGIILEDDCVPDQSFFLFCQELLEKYRDDERIMMVSGYNIYKGKKCKEFSYYFYHSCSIWGWATWRRAWVYYDVEMKLWPRIKEEGWLKRLFHDKNVEKYWTHIFNETYLGKINTWDYQWVFANFIQNGLEIQPHENLVKNIGYGDDSTHTRGSSKKANLPIHSIQFPMTHPEFIIPIEGSYAQTQVLEMKKRNIINWMRAKLHKVKSQFIGVRV